MPIEKYKVKPVSIFLFAHQDDEFGVYQQILTEQRLGRRIVCAYFTSGVPHGADPARRNQESLAVLSRLGVQPQDVVFAGAQLDIADGKLVDSLQPAFVWTKAWLSSFSSIGAVFVPAWEGGHPDHDGLHAFAVQLCTELGLAACVRQFPLYNALRCPRPLFRILNPLRENGPVSTTRIRWRQRIRFLGYALSYPSQRGSWIGLFPFLLLHYIFSGTQAVQAISRQRILERPHDGLLYYEQRRFSTWPSLSAKILAWLASRPPETGT